VFNQQKQTMLHSITYPPVPEDTARLASSLYGKGNNYLRIGNHLNQILDDLLSGNLDMPCTGERVIDSEVRCALMTIFQYAEELSNQQIIEAVRNRVELKYALHLPLNYPSLEPNTLCEFRRQLMRNAHCLQIFQRLIDRTMVFGLFQKTKVQPLEAEHVLTAVCTLNRFEEVVEAMHQALEALTVTNMEWLRQVALPYWYDRYNRKARMTGFQNFEGNWKSRVMEIAADIRYLLGKIDHSQQSKLINLPEIHSLRQIWQDQFVIIPATSTQPQNTEWRLTRCASCTQELFP
jgi:hypothetical protein